MLRQQLVERRRNRGNVDSFDWSSADPSLLSRAILSASRAGFAIQFGLTSDGGAGTVGLWDYANRAKPDVIRPTEDVDLYLLTLCEDLEYNGTLSDRT